VDLIARRFRGVLIAIVVLGLSAGAVFAGNVVLQAPASGTTAEQGDQNDQGDQNEQADQNDNEAPDADETDSADQQTPPPPTDSQVTTTTDAANHGAFVSQAAQMTTPAGFANHGAFVSCVAHMKDTSAIPTGTTTADFLGALTPEACAAAAAAQQTAKADRVHGKAGKHGKGHNRS
jgi:hypothetical protein